MFFGVTGIFWAAPAADIFAIAVTAVVMARLWKQLNEEGGRGSQEALPEYPTKEGIVVTISREHGSAGKHIGQLVAEKMKVPCYYKEMIAIAARESGLAEDLCPT